MNFYLREEKKTQSFKTSASMMMMMMTSGAFITSRLKCWDEA